MAHRQEQAAAMQARVLVVEDEMLLSMLLEDALTESGLRVCKAGRVSKALHLARTEPFDAAILDVNLDNEAVFPVAAALRERKVPFLFSSGYGERAIPAEYGDCAVLQKPFGLECFREAVLRLLNHDAESEVQ